VIALLTEARTDRVEVAINKIAALGMLILFINNGRAAIPEIEETGVQELAT
jgi:hypothetical protein